MYKERINLNKPALLLASASAIVYVVAVHNFFFLVSFFKKLFGKWLTRMIAKIWF